MKTKRKYIILWTICLFILAGLLAHYIYFSRKAEEPDRGPERYKAMRMIEKGNDYFIMVDTETGCCYLFSKLGGVCQLTNYDGSPYLANGWRDIG